MGHYYILNSRIPFGAECSFSRTRVQTETLESGCNFNILFLKIVLSDAKFHQDLTKPRFEDE
eukprot:snap_masked-scaffold_40-processed-gene-2.10-mRNA-1 protein AED:1.00 eAED:1.00 QI:0/0/0/0/1/1/2/0/61